MYRSYKFLKSILQHFTYTTHVMKYTIFSILLFYHFVCIHSPALFEPHRKKVKRISFEV